MFKSLPFLIIPFVFTLALDYLYNPFKDNFLSKKIINIHENLVLNFDSPVVNYIYSTKFIVEKEKVLTDSILSKNTIEKNIINIHESLVFNFDSSTINHIYSQKSIQNYSAHGEDSLTKIETPSDYIIEDNFLALSNESHKLYSTDLILSKWQHKFSDRKSEFIKTLLPLIVYENQKIFLERKKLINIHNALKLEKTLSNENLIYLENISKKYRITFKNKHKIDLINELLISADTIPSSIVLAQAANESGWGTSRFAREYNALFGQYTYDEQNGVIPFERAEGKKHLIKNFSSINQSVESYFKNINTHYAYQEFRKVRNQIKSEDIKFNIKKLTKTLKVYAEDESYVDTINSIIDSNDLREFDFELHTGINS